MYQEELTLRINKALRDEISSSMMYNKMAEQAMGQDLNEFSELLLENADTEYGHFKEILSYSINHNIPVQLSVDESVINIDCFTELEVNLAIIVDLEQKAYNDYKTISLLAREAEDIETETFFIEKMNDERAHLDGIVKLSKLQANKPLSFREFVLSV